MTCFGIDVSKWQTSLPNLTTVDFLFARASIGTAKDTMYQTHLAEANAAGIVTGAYHFNVGSLAIAAQVDTFLAAAGNAHLLALDVEGAGSFSDAQTRTFIAGVKAKDPLHRKVGLYMSASGYLWTGGQDFTWVAKWSSTPPAKWDFWQYTSSGSLPGYSGRLDFDRFNGTLPELYKLAGIPTAPDSGTEEPVIVISDETPVLVDLAVGTQLYDGNGQPYVKVSVKQTQHSPFEAEFAPNFHARAMTVVTGGQTVLAYVHTSDVPVRPVPAVDCTTAIAQDRAKAYVAWK